MSSQGWVKIHRAIRDNWIWTEKPFSKGQAWIDLVINANFKPNEFVLKNHLYILERGQQARSAKTLSETWGWSRGKVQRFLKTLKMRHQIEVETDTRTTVITILNYSEYQSTEKQSDTTLDTATEQQTDIGRATDEHQTSTNKNDKKEKNEKNEKKNSLTKALLELEKGKFQSDSGLKLDAVIKLWNETIGSESKLNKPCIMISPRDIELFKEAAGKLTSISDWENLFKQAENSKLFHDRRFSGSWFSFPWILKLENISDILNGKYSIAHSEESRVIQIGRAENETDEEYYNRLDQEYEQRNAV
ncbi:hypothetical protein HBN50_07935 [Halobacteriovorax sp. GB3]|uniref:hypothetical protein n=1 Tax=Halobacteriovorax sp. GB3 TaxID=2719615 RepID=UPI00235E3818|nr:hypothetical protein [Halobacteriovorax sp. GB3]MDD0853022.1 hypothetical protein [Halobacteriovorax sp. GB3]